MQFLKSKYSVKSTQIKKPYLPTLVFLFFLFAGTLGYFLMWVEPGVDPGQTFIEALYFTVITMTTIGYGEIHEMSVAGRIFTIFISVGGIGSLFYVLSVIMENLVIMQLENIRGKRKIMKQIDKLSGHVVLVGFGRVGQLAARELIKSNKEFVAIDDDFHEEDVLGEKNLLSVTGDATEDDTLIRAGIERAHGVIVTTANSATNVFVVLSAKVLNPNLYIVARADEQSAVEKLKKAGADQVVNPYYIGGQRLAHIMINPNVISFFETSFGAAASIKIENIILPDDSPWVNKTLMEIDFRQKFGVSVLAVIRDGKPELNPGGNYKLVKEDQLVVMGTDDHLKKLEESAFKKD